MKSKFYLGKRQSLLPADVVAESIEELHRVVEKASRVLLKASLVQCVSWSYYAIVTFSAKAHLCVRCVSNDIFAGLVSLVESYTFESL